jgi:hypothetical protein
MRLVIVRCLNEDKKLVLVDGEPFWGWDRLPMVDRGLARGGW